MQEQAAPTDETYEVPDEQLVARVRAGDPTAGRAIFQRHHKALLSFCRHLLGNRREAEQVVSHSCGSALGTLKRHDRPVELHVWLFAVARSRCLAVLERRGESVLPPKPDFEGLADEVALRPELRGLLEELAEMPDDQRAVLVLAELGLHDAEEIAAIVGLLHEKVEGLLAVARTTLSGVPDTGDWACSQVRGLLALSETGELRRESLRRHVADCGGCESFSAALANRRAELARVLPVEPSRDLRPPGAMNPSRSSAAPAPAPEPAEVHLGPVRLGGLWAARLDRLGVLVGRAATVLIVVGIVGMLASSILKDSGGGGGAAGGRGSAAKSVRSSGGTPSAGVGTGKNSKGRPGEKQYGSSGQGGTIVLPRRARRGGGAFPGDVARASRRVRRLARAR